MKIIVSRYNENIDWTQQFSIVLIYNKGVKLERYNEIMLHNVGREGHTYYKYIYDNYDNLEDYTIFLQGNPFDHSPNIIQNLKNYIMNYNNKNLNIDFEFLSEEIIDCNLSGCSHHPFYLPLINVYGYLFGERKESMDFIFGAGAQFIVSKKQIKNNPKDFYLKIIKMLEKDIDPIEGYVIERFHKLIFQDKNQTKKIINCLDDNSQIITRDSIVKFNRNFYSYFTLDV